MRYAHHGTPGALVSFKSAYGNYIDGQFVEPLGGEYFMNTSPWTGVTLHNFPAPMPKISTLLLMPHTAPRKHGENIGTASFQPAASGRRSDSGEPRISGDC